MNLHFCCFQSESGVALAMLVFLISIASPNLAQEKTLTEKHGNQELPKEKQTSLKLYVTAKEAYEKWKADPDKVIVLDVRTPEEYGFIGHGKMVWNIPLGFVTYDWDKENDMYKVKFNKEFVDQVKEVAKPDGTLLVMCRSGGRSAMAVNALAKAGFTKVYNIIDGMEGDKVNDPGNVYHGKRMKNGWKNSGLPWTYEIDRDRMRLPKGEPAAIDRERD